MSWLWATAVPKASSRDVSSGIHSLRYVIVPPLGMNLMILRGTVRVVPSRLRHGAARGGLRHAFVAPRWAGPLTVTGRGNDLPTRALGARSSTVAGPPGGWSVVQPLDVAPAPAARPPAELTCSRS